MPKLTDAELDEFFDEREHPAIIWRNIVGDPRVGVSIDEAVQPYRKLTAQGVVEVVHPPGQDDEWRNLYREIAKRYTADWFADAYVDGTDDQPRALCAAVLPTRHQVVGLAVAVRSADDRRSSPRRVRSCAQLDLAVPRP